MGKILRFVWKLLKLPFWILTLIASIFIAPASAKATKTATVNKATKPYQYKETEFQQLLIDKYGFEEGPKLEDRFRPDLQLGEYVIEVEWENKMYEALGQSLVYAWKSGMKPAVIILDDENKNVNYQKYLEAFAYYNVKVWIAHLERDKLSIIELKEWP